MNWIDWLWSTGATTGITLAVLYIFRDLVVRIFSKAIDTRFDAKLEAVRSDLKKSEEQFATDLRAKQTEINSIRESALSGLTSRQITLDKRRIEAVENLWRSVLSYGQFTAIAYTMSIIKFANAAESTEKDPQLREKFEKFFAPFQLEKFGDVVDASKERPFLTPLAWALYDAYRMIFGLAIAQAHAVRLGVGKEIVDSHKFTQTLIAVLPHQRDYIQRIGTAAGSYLIPEIQNKLLDELRAMLSGDESDKESVRQARDILKHAEAVRMQIDVPIVPKEFPQETPAGPPGLE